MHANVRSTSTGTGSATTVVVTKPSGVQAGDVLIAIHTCDEADTSAMLAPSGWTSLATLTAGLPTRVWRKTASTGEPSSYTWSQPPGVNGTVHVLAVKDASTSVTPRVATLDATGPTSTTPNVTPASATHLEIRYAAVSTNPETVTWTAPAGYTVRGTAQAGVQLGSVSASRQVISSTGSGSKVFGRSLPSGSRAGAGISISLASEETVPDPDLPPPYTPGVGSALYQYVFRKLRGREYLGHLDLTNVTFDKRILQPGSFSASIAIPSRTVGDLVKRVIPANETVLDRGPGVVVCEIIRGGEYWGEYWITGAKLGRSGRGVPMVQLRGSTLDAYLMHVELQNDLSFAGEDQIDIARALLDDLAVQPYADLDLVLQSGTSGVTRDREYLADQGTYGQRLVELAEVEDGFEWTINTITGASGLERHWVWATKLGQQSPILHQFSDGRYGGDILAWDEDIDALRGATRWRARGGTPDSGDASTVATPLISSLHEATAHLTAGWPRLDRTITRSSVTVQQTLEDWAAYWVAVAPGALRVDSVTVAIGAQPSFTPNSLGDMARIRLDNEWHDSVVRDRRIIGMQITPESRSGKEEAQLILEGQEVE